MKTKNIVIIVKTFVYVLFCFYGINWLALYLLPKWVDVLIGFPLSMYFLYKAVLCFNNVK